MEIKIKNKRSLLLVIAFGVLLYWGLEHLDEILDVAGGLFGVVFPFLLGGAIAFVLHVPLRFFERLLTPALGEKKGVLRAVSILLSLLLAVGIVAFVFMMVIPELIDTISQINEGMPAFMEGVNARLQELSKIYPQAGEALMSLEINWADLTQQMLGFLKNSLGNVVSSTWGWAATVIGGIASAGIGLIFSVYILAEKEKLGLQFRKIIYAYLPERAVAYILKVGHLANKTFSGFISGQCTEAVVFGLLCYIGMTIFHFPYAACVSVLIGFMTLLPIVGAFLGTAFGALLIMVSSPVKALWFIVLILVLQQIDGNLIYPRIVGGSVGLPSMWVLAAVTVGGNLLGVGGMLIFVPLSSVCYALLREHVYHRLTKKKISEETLLGEAEE